MTLNKNWYLTEVELDKADGYIRPLLAHEGDVGGRGIALKVVENGQPVNLTGYAVTLDWAIGKSWGSESFTTVNASKGEFTIEYPVHMQIPGKLTARISINKGETFITGSRNFELHVQKAPVSNEKIEGDKNYSLLMRLVAQVEETIENITDAETKARAAAVSANSAASSANSAATKARNAATDAERATVDARSAIDEATAATELANAAAENANKAGHDAWTAAPAATAAAEAATEAAAKAADAASNAASAATDASSAAIAANEAAERANAAAGGKVIEFCSTEVAVSAVRALF